MVAWIFVEAACLSAFRTTPGKSLCRVTITQPGTTGISYSDALARSGIVWWRGLGAGVPIISFFTMINAYRRLSADGVTSWDREGGFSVTNQPLGVARGFAVAAFVVVLVILLAVTSTL